MLARIIALWLASAAPAAAQPFVMAPGPKSPAESLACIQVRPGFTVELMAAEPLVMDPIAFAWGPDGKFWVVEMGDYPLGAGVLNKPGGRVKFLEKTDKPGARQPLTPNPSPQEGAGSMYDKATVFLDGLNYPTGVTPWGKGVIVTCAPDIFYAEDADGDGKADKKIVLFTGFREGNQQHRVNGLVWGLDNWLYGANGDSGGVITALNALARQPDGSMKPVPPLMKGGPGGVNISGRDFRLKPDTGEFEAVTGQTQFGRCRDDWGNWFGNNNSNPLFHFVLEDRYLKRNPHVLYPDPRVNVSVTPGASPVYPISKPLPRFNDAARLNHITSACSAIIYRDDLFGPEFYGNSFVSEPVHNLIHREIVKPKGVTFTSRRAADEKESEFLASTDNWFRPATTAVGPDGALWIADMYRYVIEHPEWIPQDWQKKLDLRAGHDKGRIYRVYPKGKKPREIVRLDRLGIDELVKALDSSSGWTRDTAQHLLTLHGTEEEARLIRRRLLDTLEGFTPARHEQALVHALGVLDGLDRLTSAEVVKAMTAKHSRVRRAALQYAERPRFAYRDVGQELRVCAADDDPQVRLQAVFTAGSCTTREAGSLLADVLAADQDNPFIVAAALSSVSKSNATEFLGSLGKHRGLSAPLLAKLFRVAQGYGATSAMGRLVMNHFVAAPDQPLSSEHLYHLADFFDAMGGSVEPFLKSLRQQDANAALRFFARLHAETKRIVRDPKTPLGDRVLALQLLGRGLGDDGEDCNLLQEQLAPQYPEDVHLAAVQQFGAMTDLRVPSRLTANWKSYSPSLRTRVIDTLLARGEWTRSLMELIESKKILPAEIDTIRRQTLLDHRDAAVRKAAARIFAASSDPDRAKLVSRYWIALPPQGDIARGSKHFAKHCAACHQLGGIGQQVGPELASVGDKSPEGLLSAILDPNRAVEARYVNYIAATSAGVTVSGLLQGETSTTITLIAADGKKHDLLRRDIEELTSTGKSVMPEGFEKELPPADMADLIAFLRGHLAKPKVFAGNRPDTAKAGADGVLRLTAANAAIFGKTLVFEEKHQNLGYWSSSDDHAVWTVEVPKDGRYEVWLDFACDPSAAGNTLALQAADARLTHQVRSTASWGLYRQAKVGVIRLPAGRHEIIVRPEGAIRLALIDLKAIELRPAE